jgi:hypothetical protein
VPAGNNGAGKWNADQGSGVFQYDQGDIYLDGKRVAFATPQEAGNNGSRRSIRIWRWRNLPSDQLTFEVTSEGRAILMRLPGGSPPNIFALAKSMSSRTSDR